MHINRNGVHGVIVRISNQRKSPVRLERLKALGIRSVILDDGWSVNHGDWTPDPEKFPNGDVDFKKLDQ